MCLPQNIQFISIKFFVLYIYMYIWWLSQLCMPDKDVNVVLSRWLILFFIDCKSSPVSRLKKIIMWLLFFSAPSVIIYDNACNLHSYCMNRDPIFFKKTRFLVDRLHWRNHRCKFVNYTYKRNSKSCNTLDCDGSLKCNS